MDLANIDNNELLLLLGCEEFEEELKSMKDSVCEPSINDDDSDSNDLHADENPDHIKFPEESFIENLNMEAYKQA